MGVEVELQEESSSPLANDAAEEKNDKDPPRLLRGWFGVLVTASMTTAAHL